MRKKDIHVGESYSVYMEGEYYPEATVLEDTGDGYWLMAFVGPYDEAKFVHSSQIVSANEPQDAPQATVGKDAL